MRATLFAIVQLFCLASGLAQEQVGLVHDNQTPLEGALLNPARLAGQWPYVDVRVAGIGLNAWNDMVALSGGHHSLVGEVRNGIRGTTDDNIKLRSSFNTRNKKGLVLADVRLPAVSIALGRGTFAAGLRSRAHVSVTGVPYTLGRVVLNGLRYEPQLGERYRLKNMRVIAAAWSEFALSYGHIIQASGSSMLSAGASLKYASAHMGSALRFDVLDHTVIDSAQVDIHEASGSFGISRFGLGVGNGWGADVGLVYERTLDEADRYMPHRSSSGCTPMEYRYRIGVSIVDLGMLKFTNVTGGTFKSASTSIADYNTLDVAGADGVDSLMNSLLSNYTTTTALKVGTPTALSIQYDQRLLPHVYVGSVFVQQLASTRGTRIRRANTIAITPRLETKYVSIALPISMREYDIARPMVGLMVRLNNLVIGTDHLLPIFIRQDIHALDAYVMLRLNINRGPFCRGKGRKRAYSPGSGDALPCALPQ